MFKPTSSILLILAVTFLTSELAVSKSSFRNRRELKEKDKDKDKDKKEKDKDVEEEESEVEAEDDTVETEPAWCDTPRYWDFFSFNPDVRVSSLVDVLDYSDYTWDMLFTNQLEKESYDSFSKTDTQRGAINTELGFDEDQFDCCMNHYEWYDWADFQVVYENGENYADQILALEALGWTEEMWESEDPNDWADTDYMYWDELTEYQREMAERKLCYTRETWNWVPLSQWPEDAWIPDYW